MVSRTNGWDGERVGNMMDSFLHEASRQIIISAEEKREEDGPLSPHKFYLTLWKKPVIE